MELHYVMRMDLGMGEYDITVALHPGFSHLERCYHWKEDAVRFTIVQYKGPQFSGIVRLLPSLKVQSSRSA